MRIIAGRLGGRVFDSPSSNLTHPMSDKMRGALFNALGNINGLSVLDAFGGSGALSFEAISRGAAHALIIDSSRIAQKTAKRNIELLNIGQQVKFVKASVSAWMQTNPDIQFDIVLADPPYDNLQKSQLQKLVRYLSPNGIFTLSWPNKESLLSFESLELVKQKLYGDAQLVFYKQVS